MLCLRCCLLPPSDLQRQVYEKKNLIVRGFLAVGDMAFSDPFAEVLDTVFWLYM